MGAFGASTTKRLSRVFTSESGGSAGVLGIEVTQAIQNLAQDVRLVAGKRTVARVYLEPRQLRRTVRVRGEVAVSTSPGAPERYVPSLNVVSLRKENHPDLQAQRDDVDLSLNFDLPSPEGPQHLRIHRLIPVAHGDDVPISKADTTRNLTFESAAPLRIRVIGLRFTDDRVHPPQSFAPDALHFDYLRSYLTRTYPVPSLDWSQIVVPAGPAIKPPFSDGTSNDPRWQSLAAKVIVRLQQIRQADLNGGRDPRTHYYGLLADDKGFFRGRASKVPQVADPSTVAFGPAGRRGFPWDTDGSYADWYGAHELGHTFGCRHPGVCGNQVRDPLSSFPYANGRISDGQEDCVGFDPGDTTLGLPMRALPRQATSDFMTYCDDQWISRHTYDKLFTRLQQENIQSTDGGGA